MYIAVNEVIPQPNYLLTLTFNNGEKRQFDMKPYLEKGNYQELKDMNMFNTVRPSFDTVEWANEADIDPEVLYEQSIEIS